MHELGRIGNVWGIGQHGQSVSSLAADKTAEQKELEDDPNATEDDSSEDDNLDIHAPFWKNNMQTNTEEKTEQTQDVDIIFCTHRCRFGCT